MYHSLSSVNNRYLQIVFGVCNLCMSFFHAVMYVQLEGVVQEYPSPDHCGEDGGRLSFLIASSAILLIHVLAQLFDSYMYCSKITHVAGG